MHSIQFIYALLLFDNSTYLLSFLVHCSLADRSVCLISSIHRWNFSSLSLSTTVFFKAWTVSKHKYDGPNYFLFSLFIHLTFFFATRSFFNGFSSNVEWDFPLLLLLPAIIFIGLSLNLESEEFSLMTQKHVIVNLVGWSKSGASKNVIHVKQKSWLDDAHFTSPP